MKEELIEICKRYTLSDAEQVVVPEAYIPYIPINWNKILVLAESQNLSKTNSKYVNSLKSLTSIERMQRLGHDNLSFGVAPWSDGSLKLAIESAFDDEKADSTGVSNAVLWSQRSATGANINPSNELIEISSKLWKEYLFLLNPKLLITAGKKAENVINKTGWNGKHICLRLPAKTAMSRISGMFKTDDLLERYPEVKQVVHNNPEWVEDYRSNKVFFACHAVSIIKSGK